MERFSSTSDSQLADDIVTWSGRIAAGEAELLACIGEFDHREAWGGTGLLSCAHWLSWRTGLSPTAAREKVRVARALRELSQVQEAFGAGRLSYSQVRAITRVATVDEQDRWVEAARHSTAGQLERLVRGVRRARAVDEATADPELAAWRMRATKTYDADGNAVYRIVLPAEQAAIVDAAIEAMQTRLDREWASAASSAQHEAPPDAGPPAAASAEAACPQPETSVIADTEPDASAEATSPQEAAPRRLELVRSDTTEQTGSAQTADAADPSNGSVPRRSTLADALVEIARTALESQAATAPADARRNRSALVAHVDPISGWGRLRNGELLPPTSLAAVMRTLPGRDGAVRLRALTAQELRTHDLGRSRRRPSLALRELLGTLDGERCRFPGCTRHRRLHAHHVAYWSEDGPTDLANMVLLCGRHHTLVHQLGFALVLHPDRTLTVGSPEGVPVPHHPGLPWRPAVELDPAGHIDAETLPPSSVAARVDIRYGVMVLAQQSA